VPLQQHLTPSLFSRWLTLPQPATHAKPAALVCPTQAFFPYSLHTQSLLPWSAQRKHSFPTACTRKACCPGLSNASILSLQPAHAKPDALFCLTQAFFPYSLHTQNLMLCSA